MKDSEDYLPICANSLFDNHEVHPQSFVSNFWGALQTAN